MRRPASPSRSHVCSALDRESSCVFYNPPRRIVPFPWPTALSTLVSPPKDNNSSGSTRSNRTAVRKINRNSSKDQGKAGGKRSKRAWEPRGERVLFLSACGSAVPEGGTRNHFLTKTEEKKRFQKQI